MTLNLNEAFPGFTPRPATVEAWEATADNTVRRHYADPRTISQAKVGKQRINDLRSRLVDTSATIDKILKELDEMDAVVAGAPSEELATAQQALLDLQKRNDNLIKQCQSWKKRAADAEAGLERASGIIEQVQKQAETPNFVTFVRRGTPGDSVRYLAGEVMKYAHDNIELAGIAVALRMVGADVDSLPQGRP